MSTPIMKYTVQSSLRNNVFLHYFDKTQAHNPNYCQKRMVDAVTKALISGISDDMEMHAFVSKELIDIVPTEAHQHATKHFETSVFEHDIDNARKVITKRLTLKANRKVLETLQATGLVYVGQKINNIQHREHKYSSTIVTGLDRDSGVIHLKCAKPGTSHKWLLNISANDQQLLSLLTEDVKDNTVEVLSSKGDICSFIIDMKSHNNAMLFPLIEHTSALLVS